MYTYPFEIKFKEDLIINDKFDIQVVNDKLPKDYEPTQNDIDDTVHIGNVHHAITVHVTTQGIDFPGEIARIAWAAVDMGVGLVHVVLIIDRSLATDKMGAFIKHVAGLSHVVCLPAFAGKYRFQLIAAVEHAFHVPHVAGVEATQVKGNQRFAALEHVFRFCHIRGLEVTQVQSRHRFAASEHVFHLYHLWGVKAAQVKGRQ